MGKAGVYRVVGDMLRDCFDDYGLAPYDVKDRRRRKVLRVHGKFGCANKVDARHKEANAKAWTSHYAWVLVDLHKLELKQRWHQKCSVCKSKRSPFVSRDALKEPLHKMMLEVLEERNGIYHAPDKALMPNAPGDPMHPTALCEKCRWGSTCCNGNGKLRVAPGPDRGAPPSDASSDESDASSDELVDELAAQLARTALGGSKWAELKPLKPHVPTRKQRWPTALVLNGIRRAFEAVDKGAAGAEWLSVLEAGSRGKGTELNKSDLDVVLSIRGFEPTTAFVSAALERARNVLRRAGAVLSVVSEIKVSPRALHFTCEAGGASVDCDVLLGGLDAAGKPRDRPQELSEAYDPKGRDVTCFLLSASFNHLQIRHFKRMPPEFRTLCRMAKVWQRDGAKVPKCSSSYLLELVVLEAWVAQAQAREPHEPKPQDHEPESYQLVFRRFLELVERLPDASLVFEHFYERSDVPEQILRMKPLVLSLSNPVVNTVHPKFEVAALRAAAAAELQRSYQVASRPPQAPASNASRPFLAQRRPPAMPATVFC
ncbi:hypothetical protein M885DRAFT_570584 [Pelagophyceae sp. CCMP2097]|nr:hypothetical protein M885DRAFT_570584 [Pelagophyceae sp. CCMP2097]|mmetsp:Transcript_15655/g.55718  ORF Transcript_15655/g.55718 Transcript_15655/m.55718 type:complete len:543 (-) Transcript_15655:61-1689(-)